MWLEKVTMAVLVADPSNRSFHVYRDKAQIRILRSGDVFVAGDACPGWELSVDVAIGLVK
jgi:hypothetical protein